jgi:hypothetical protein
VNVILLAATGMVGQGVLRECLLDPFLPGPSSNLEPSKLYSGVVYPKQEFDGCLRVSSAR